TGARLFYNAEDPEVCRIVEKSGKHLDKNPYRMPVFNYENGKARVETKDGKVTINILGSHNLLNMEAAVAVCKALGIPEQKAYQAIASFSGAARRLEKVSETENLVLFRDFAHAPSKLKATLHAVREAYPEHRLIACFELHTYSSLNEKFLGEYAQSMDAADK